jgi:hypothetical protein
MPAPSPDDLIPLSELPRELRSAADLLDLERDALARVSYRTCYGYVADGLIPAERQGRSWSVRRKDLAEIVSVLGLAPKRRVGRPRKAASPSNAAVAA